MLPIDAKRILSRSGFPRYAVGFNEDIVFDDIVLHTGCVTAEEQRLFLKDELSPADFLGKSCSYLFASANDSVTPLSVVTRLLKARIDRTPGFSVKIRYIDIGRFFHMHITPPYGEVVVLDGLKVDMGPEKFDSFYEALRLFDRCTILVCMFGSASAFAERSNVNFQAMFQFARPKHRRTLV